MARRGFFAQIVAHPAVTAAAVLMIFAVDVLATKAVLAAEGSDVVSSSGSLLAVLTILLASMVVIRSLIQRHRTLVRVRSQNSAKKR